MMVARGLKRKLRDPDEGGGLWENQLQSVLDISWDKYQRDQALVEPSLRRSVLINNTLRQVQSEVRTSLSLSPPPPRRAQLCAQPESTSPGHSGSSCSLVVSEEMEEEEGEEFLRCHSEEEAGFLSCHSEEEAEFLSCHSEEDFSLSSAISAILKNLEADSSYSSSVPQRSPLSSVENIFTTTADRKFKPSQTFIHNTDTCRTSETGSGLQEATIDELLLDMDTSVFEKDVNAFDSRGFSFPAGDLVRYLPSLSGSSSPAPSSSSGSREMQELEHIMDILVRS